MFTPEMCSSAVPSNRTLLTIGDQNLGVFTGMTGGEPPLNHDSVVENFPVVHSPLHVSQDGWVFWGKPARPRTVHDVALRGAIHNPHALLTLLPNISLSIYKGLP
jgi:hypothetical protein